MDELRHSLSRWLALSGHERLLFIEGWIVLFSARFVFRAIPFRWLWKLIGESEGPASTPASALEIARISQAIDRASARVPHATCLTRGLAAALLLRFAGHPYRLIVGVDNGAGGFSAHAWVVSEGQVVTGNAPDLSSYTPLNIGAAIPPANLT
jgi:hypothetical protein